jgi:XTP/dITP diphosphohydrolase
MMKLVFATNNPHKLKEVKRLLSCNHELLGLSEAGIETEIPETQNTIEGNASQKSNFIFSNYNINCFADDTGLEVEALNGAPGVFSARFSLIGDIVYPKMEVSEGNNRKLLYLLSDQVNRKARFRTVISLIINGKEYFFEGIVNGYISRELKGIGGFGYDPLFVPKGFKKTFAELDIDQKNRISHRAIATKKLIKFLDELK